MLRWLEQLSEANQHTIAALGAISTLAAVVVSLVLALIAQRSNRTRINARATVSVMLHSTLEGRPKPKYVTVTITNVGLMPVMIPFSFFHWKMPFKGGSWMINPWDYSQHDPWVPQRTYPAEIRPRGSATFFLSEIDRFRSTMAEMLQEVRHLRWRVRFIKAIVLTDDGKIFKVKLDRTIRRELAKVRRIAKALDHL
jgi:hypothetical protein